VEYSLFFCSYNKINLNRKEILHADKQALERQFYKQGLDIYNRELVFFTNSSTAVATQGALLLGFAYYGVSNLTLLRGSDGNDVFAPMESLFYIASVLALTLQMFVLAQSLILVVSGENLALRGPEGSMHRAVDGMRGERTVIFLAFGAGLVSLLMAVIGLAWSKIEHPAVPSIMTTVILAFFCLLYHHYSRITKKFEIPKDKVVTGAIQSRPQIQNVIQEDYS